MLDALDDAWRRVGRIDLIAGPDLATRTMGARMLEAFLLRRADEQFLKTDEEVELRLSNLHSLLDGDAHYPVNGVYCSGTTWQRAIEGLAPNSDAILMDLRGFTKRNEGCVFELTWLVQQIPLSRIVLLADGTTDYHGLEEVIRTAWAELPPALLQTSESRNPSSRSLIRQDNQGATRASWLSRSCLRATGTRRLSSQHLILDSLDYTAQHSG